jgi:Protein of unknown function (DUF1570)
MNRAKFKSWCAVWMALVCVWLLGNACAAAEADFMFRASVDGRQLEGKPLRWSADEIMLLGRDGQLYEFDPKTAEAAAKTGPRFIGYSLPEMKRALLEEFGERFDVSTTSHYVVVSPRGSGGQWADRFEQLYKRFNHYFRVRGFTTQEPPYPLVAIVYRDQAEYYRAAAAGGTALQPGTLGHFDPKSNRVFLFDLTSEGADWSQNAETIIHEATHQVAYNTGIHKRFTVEPQWVVEGLATMFEAPGVWNAQYDKTQSDRINRGRLESFEKYAANRRRPGALAELIAGDQRFRTDVDGAYAEAWALSFYLSETQPRLYATYLAKTAERPLFGDYSATERMADFQQVFGADMKMLETKFLRFMEDVK